MIAMNDFDNRANENINIEPRVSKSLLDPIIKFHQSTCTLFNENAKSTNASSDIINWAVKNEFTDVVPDYFYQKINLKTSNNNTYESSCRVYDKGWVMGEEVLATILYRSFGRNEERLTKKYPSAGSLYPVIPLLYVFSEKAISKNTPTGSYVFDSTNLNLLLIRQWKKSDLINVEQAISIGKGFQSNLAIAYAVDIRRAIAKYRGRGYRHALIEVGLMAQSFRETIREVDSELGELCWSGFIDNALTYYSGLNLRLAPVSLVQWFGKRGD